MSDAASTEAAAAPAAGLLHAAARGELPHWAEAGPARRAHMARVATLLGEWSDQLGLDADERVRWVAIGWLHDALRDAPAESLRDQVPPQFRDFPGPLLHGPAAAEKLTALDDPSFLNAVRYHTIGHPDLGLLGRALYLADFLEPGRDFEVEWRATLLERMPGDMTEVLLEVLGARIAHLIEVRKPIRPETAGFWSRVVGRG